MYKSKKKSLKTMGGRIRAIRGELTQMDFAERLNIKQAMVSRYEADKEIPSSKILMRMARFSGKSVEWLLAGDSYDLVKKGSPLDKAVQAFLNSSMPYRDEFAVLTKDAFTNKDLMRKLLSYYNFLEHSEGENA